MALSVHRALDELSDGISRWLDATLDGHHELIRCEHASEGLSSETILCEARPFGSDRSRGFVVRLPPLGEGAFPDYDLGVQAEAQRVAEAHGVAVASPVELVNDSSWLGSPFLVAPLVVGHVPGAVPLHDEWITGSPPARQRRMYSGLVDQLAAVHRIDVHSIRGNMPVRDIERELGYWRAYLDWYADGAPRAPILHDAYAWCVDHRPDSDPPPSMLWGDVRLGNIIFDDEGEPVAVLDWEMTMVGAAEHDVAWWVALERIQDELFGRRVAGFPPLADARRAYEERLGRALQDMGWYEVLAMVRSTAIMTRIAVLYERAGLEGFLPIDDNPVLAILARKIEGAA
jgi:aminoglycoside phosphotransferase (APT) family kinase protein